MKTGRCRASRLISHGGKIPSYGHASNRNGAFHESVGTTTETSFVRREQRTEPHVGKNPAMSLSTFGVGGSSLQALVSATCIAASLETGIVTLKSLVSRTETRATACMGNPSPMDTATEKSLPIGISTKSSTELVHAENRQLLQTGDFTQNPDCECNRGVRQSSVPIEI